MLDKEKEQGDRQEVNEVKAAPEVQRSGVIGDAGNQARWNRVQQAHYLGQDESATDLFRKNGDTSSSTSKFTIDGLAKETPSVAYDMRDLQKDLRKVGNGIESSRKALGSFEIPARLEPLNVVYPHRGNEDAYISYPACKAANAAFPELAKRIGDGRNHLDRNLIAATIRLEQEFYKQGFDTGPDKQIQESGRVEGLKDTTSIGPAQIQIRHIDRLVKEFPLQLGEFSKDPLRAALKSECAPRFVAGYFADVIQHIQKGTKPDFIGEIDWGGVKKYWAEGNFNDALIYAYNPTKDHIDSVIRHLRIIRQKF